MLYFRFCLVLVLFLSAPSAFAQDARSAAKSDLEKVYEAAGDIKLDTGKGFGVKNVVLERDGMRAVLEDGALFFTDKILNRVYIGVYLGKGNITFTVPEKIKDRQWKQVLWQANKDASRGGVVSQPFEDAYMVLTEKDYGILTGKTVTSDGVVTVLGQGEGGNKKYIERALAIFNQPRGYYETQGISRLQLTYWILNRQGPDFCNFEARSKDFGWLGYYFSDDAEREAVVYRRELRTIEDKQILASRGGVSFDKTPDYAKGENWVQNLRWRLMEDREHVAVEHYDMNVRVLKAGMALQNTMKMRFHVRRDFMRAPAFQFLSSWSDAKRRVFKIQEITDAEGKPLPYWHDDNGTLMVDFGAPLEKGKPYEIKLKYEASFLRTLDDIIKPDDINPVEWQKILTNFLDFLPTSPSTYQLLNGYPWYPMANAILHPSTYDVRFEVPEPLLAIAAGNVVERWNKDGYSGVRVRVDEPISLFAVIFGNYNMLSADLYDTKDPQQAAMAKKWGNPVITACALDRQRDMLQSVIDNARRILAFYNDNFDVPFRYKNLSIVQMAFFQGFGQAPPGLVQLTGDYFIKPTERDKVNLSSHNYQRFVNNVLSHEIAHQWWPDVIGMRNYEQDAWLSEAFAEYTSVRFAEADAADSERAPQNVYQAREAVNGFLEEWFYSLFGFKKINTDRDEGSVYSPGPSYQKQVYQKGPYVLHMLRNIIGGDLFQKTMQRFLKDYANKQPTTADFIDTVRTVVAEHAQSEKFMSLQKAGKPIQEWPFEVREELERLKGFYPRINDWFEDWYMDPGHLKLRYSWRMERAEKGNVAVLKFNQNPAQVKVVLLPISFYDKKERIGFTLQWLDKPEQEIRVNLGGREPVRVVLDENRSLPAEFMEEKS